MEKDLTDINLTLLAIISAKPLNAYRIIKAMERAEGGLFYIKESTLYSSLRNMEKKGLILGEYKSESNMPAKKVYSLTEKGREVLEKKLVSSLENLESNVTSFEKAINFICTISKGEAVKAIQKHRNRLESELAVLRSRFSEYRTDGSVPFTVKVLTRQMIKKRQVELDTLNELQKEIEWDRSWDYFPSDLMLV